MRDDLAHAWHSCTSTGTQRMPSHGQWPIIKVTSIIDAMRVARAVQRDIAASGPRPLCACERPTPCCGGHGQGPSSWQERSPGYLPPATMWCKTTVRMLSGGKYPGERSPWPRLEPRPLPGATAARNQPLTCKAVTAHVRRKRHAPLPVLRIRAKPTAIIQRSLVRTRHPTGAS